MELLKQPPTAKDPAEWFIGDVWFDVLYRGEEHWHGAAPDGGPENTWLEHVTDTEYERPRVRARV
ncbi:MULTISPECIES: hypothetical protein [unclassified Frankia]|uniref:hypothetical protein n=1 Tax=unclassified Frankia TaxID=2632575 RepID=UPI002AD49ACD|nr:MULTISPECIES: hypothetical protein [unclassified Frankia]